MQNTTDFSINFFNSSGTPISPPASIAAGTSIYVSLPIVAGRPAGFYEDMLSVNIGGTTRSVLNVQQRVGCVISDITPAAIPPNFNVLYPTSQSVNFSITMTIPNPEINCLSVTSYANYAYFLVSTDSNFESALAGSNRGDWVLFPITETGDPVINSTHSFSGYTAGTYYIHWYGESGNEGSTGTFGPYIIDDITYTVTYNGNGHTGGTPPTDPNSPYRTGDPVTILGPGTMVRTCHTFMGWATTSTATTPVYAYNSGTGTFTPSTFNIVANTTLYAVWRNDNVTPTFSISPTAYCQGATPASALPLTSNNGITGTWSPSANINTATAGTFTYTFTPTAGLCATTYSISITINPRPAINPITRPVCSGGTFVATPVNGTNGTVPANTTYTWTVSPASSPTGVSGQSNGTNQTAISQTLTNNTNAPVNVVYTVTPTSNLGCAGNNFTVTVTVNPNVNGITNITRTICSGETFTATPVNGTNGLVPTSGMTYSWTVSPLSSLSGVSGQSAQSNQATISQTLKNHTNAPVNVVYTVTPKWTSGAENCTGNTFTVTVTVNFTPVVVPIRICNPSSM
jgi:hypothetical protein